jgi:hypothetical protein
MQGVLRISTAGATPDLAVGVIRQRYNERGNVVLSSIPLIPSSALPVDAELVVPHVIDGSGYTTSFVYINTSAGPLNILQRTVGPTGQKLDLDYK